MFFELKGGQGGKSVGVFRAAYDHGINGAGLVVNLPEIGIFGCTGMLPGSTFQVVAVHIAQGHNIFAGNVGQIACATATCTDNGQVQAFVGTTGFENARECNCG